MFYRVLWGGRAKFSWWSRNAKTVGVGNASRAELHNRNFLGDGRVATNIAQNVPEDDPTEVPKMT